jgi:outer membrane protein assembly factor BamB
VSDGVLYVTKLGKLWAFREGCVNGGDTCTHRWTADVGRAYEPPVAGDGIVYEYDPVGGTVYAFRTDCSVGLPPGTRTGGVTCSPLWTAPTTPTTRQPPSAVARFGDFRMAVSEGIVYAVAKADDRLDRLYAFDAGTGRRLWLAAIPHPHGRSIDSGNTPVVAGGLVFVDFDDTLYSFPASCRTDGGMCDPAWTWPYHGPGHSGPPVVAGDSVYLRSWSSLSVGRTYAFPVDCGTGGSVCEPTWTATDDGWGDVVVGGDLVVSTSNDSQRLDAFPASCGTEGTTCRPAWRATTPAGAPTAVVANGVVYAGTDGGVSKVGGRIYAFPESCEASAGECQPAWTSAQSGGWMSPPAVDGSMLFATAGDGKVYAFGLGGDQRGLTRSQRHDTAVFYIMLAVLLGAVLLLRIRRRRATPQLRK